MAEQPTTTPPSEFENRRADLIGVIGDGLEKVLQQLNSLNRNLEGIITIGNEFSAVEALWSQFENFMGSQGGGEGSAEAGDGDARGHAEGEGREVGDEGRGREQGRGQRGGNG